MKNERMYQELLEFIRTDSAPGQERAIAEKLMPKLRELGFSVTMDDAGTALGGNCGNVFAWREGERDGSLLLCSHMDRVGEGFGIDPVEQDGILRSNGTTILAADDVSGICTILEGLRQSLSSGHPLPRLEVLFTVSEEVGLLGAKQVDLSQLRSKIGLFFDSPGPVGRIINSAPGLYYLGAELTGRRAHAGNEPEKGIDAAKIMCDILSTLRQGRLDPMSTANFPVISTGAHTRNAVCDRASFGAHTRNAVCDRASFGGEARSRDAKRLEAYVTYFKEHCLHMAEERGAGITLEIEELFRPFQIGEEQEVLRLAKRSCESVGLECRIESGGGGMDANVFNAKGIPSIGIATGYHKNHSKDEYLVLEDFYRAGDLAAAMIQLYGR